MVPRLAEKTDISLKPDDVEKYLSGYFKDSEFGLYYIKMHLMRFIETIKLFPHLSCDDKVLELGSYPPFVSLLLKRHFEYEQHLNCFFQDAGRIKEVELVNEDEDERHLFKYHNFDVEKDAFPFRESSFDVVTSFELIEHLKYDPMFMLIEANKILKMGGRIFITTPNVASLRSIHFLINGYAPFYYPKFAYHVGTIRHYREFTPHELKIMLESAGFEIELLTTIDVWRQNPEGFDYQDIYEQYTRFLKDFKLSTELRGEDIFVIGKKTGAVKDRFPEQLYQR